MAQEFLTDKTAFAGTLVDADLIHIVDVSDTSQNPAGSSYKLTLLQLKTYMNIFTPDLATVLGVGRDVDATGTINDSTSIASIDFNNRSLVNSGGSESLNWESRLAKIGQWDYDADYSGTYTSRSLVDKAYVDGAIVNTFLGLTDTPSSFAGQSLKFVRVNAGETALEFVASIAETLATTLAAGNTTGANDIDITEGQSIIYNTASGGPFTGSLDGPTLTANRIWTLPNNTGTIALLSDIPSTPSLATVLGVGNTTGGTNISLTSGDTLDFNVGSGGSLTSASTASARTWTLPDNTGTIALLSDITAGDLETVLGVGNTSGANDLILSKTGTATSTVTQVGSQKIQFQASLWDGGAEDVQTWDIYAVADTGVNQKSYLYFDIDGVNKMTIASSSVGIGTTTPGATLHVKGSGNTNTTYGFFVRNSDDDLTYTIRDDGRIGMGTTTFSADLLTLKTKAGISALSVVDQNDVEWLQFLGDDVTAAHGLGIGEVSSLSGGEFFQLRNATLAQGAFARISSAYADGYRAELQLQNEHTGGLIWKLGSTNNSDGNFGGGKLGIYQGTSYTGGLILADNAAGFGLNAPTARVHIKGTGATSGTYSMKIENSSGTVPLLYVRDDNHIGIGTSTPNAALDVRRTGGSSALIVADNGGTTYFEVAGSGGAGGTSINFFGGQNSVRIDTGAYVSQASTITSYDWRRGSVKMWVLNDGTESGENVSYADLLIKTTQAAADNGVKDSLKLIFRGIYDSDPGAGVTQANYNADVYLKMLTAGASPTGRLDFRFAGVETISFFNTGEVTVGTTTLDSSAILQLSSTSQGFLPPVMTGAQVEAISSPATGLLAYATNAGAGDVTAAGWWGYNGTNWVQVG